MRRRDLFRYAGVMALASAGRFARAQATSTSMRGAVVIGVDNISHMAKLSASRDADKVEQWLVGEGFEVKKFTDARGVEVTEDDLYRAVKDFVDRSNLDMLLIYFAGHGFANGRTEFWMLSGAPENPNRVVSLFQSMLFAQYCGVPNVVLISDACRSIPATPQLQMLESGSAIFPNFGPNDQGGNVDTLKAASFGAPAYEGPIVSEIAAKGGIFTDVLMGAFRQPSVDMTDTLDTGEVIIKNSKLKDYLRAEVNRRAQAISITSRQFPEITVNSDSYIAKVHTQVRSGSTAVPPVSPRDVLNYQLRKTGVSFDSGFDRLTSDFEIEASQSFAKFEDLKVALSDNNYAVSFETQTGISVVGGRVSEYVVAPYLSASEVSMNNIGVSLDTPCAEVLVEFEGQSFSVLPVIKGFITNVAWGPTGIASVTFVPSSNAPRWSEYAVSRDRIDELHAIIASASTLNGFRIEGNPETRERRAEAMADDIRLGKSVDPTLGIYAAYAYAQAGLERKVQSVANFMRSDLEFEFFDLAMLAEWRARAEGGTLRSTLFPLWPMLAQGWEYLLPYQMSTDYSLQELRPFLLPSLWTTLGPQAKLRVRQIIETRISAP
ncbi:caspase family protein [Rhizobium leguminosarum]|uniref:caspase family protein n=1 Tax=Rhizobium leguminosarum TaxID=384 RepID=UPI0013F14C97|nr:caspase family protein [Rhizobium leguminosarum]